MEDQAADNINIGAESGNISRNSTRPLSPTRESNSMYNSPNTMATPNKIDKISIARGNLNDEAVDNVTVITKAMQSLAEDLNSLKQSPVTADNIEKISVMSKILTNEANALSKSIKHLSQDMTKTKQDLGLAQDDVFNFPYHLFLLEIIVNKINMKCECFEDYNNLVITCSFLGKQPVVIYNSSPGTAVDYNKINVGKSSLFAMTYDKICSIEEFVVLLELLKQPPCSHSVTKIAETQMDYSKDFKTLREDLCRQWTEEKPNDTITCTSSSSMQKKQFYLISGDSEHPESIGIIEVSLRMSFLGKEITTAFSTTNKPQGSSSQKEDNGISLYSCQDVEMDDGGKIFLEENCLQQTKNNYLSKYNPGMRNKYQNDGMSKYDEIYTKMNSNELKIRVPKTNKIERMGTYDKIYDLCECENSPCGEQIQFDLPQDLCYPEQAAKTYTSNLKYTINKNCHNRKPINVTPPNCPPRVSMEKMPAPGRDVFILKIGKKLETKDKKTDLEIELVTPQAHSTDRALNSAAQQCASASSVKSKPSKSSTSKKGKGKGKKKKGKGKSKEGKKEKTKKY